MAEYEKTFSDPSDYFHPCPALTDIYAFKVDRTKHDVYCSNVYCYGLFTVLNSWMVNAAKASTPYSCLFLDTSTNNKVPISTMNCTNGAPTPTFTTWLPSTATATPGSTSASATPQVIFQNQTTEASNNSLWLAIVGCTIAVALIGAYVVYRLRRQQRPQGAGDEFHLLEATPAKTGSTKNTQASSADEVDGLDALQLWRLDTREVTLERKLAEGAFGEVWYGTYMDEPVAVKTLLKTTAATVHAFLAEIQLVAKMDCDHIVRFIGVSYKRLADVQLITEFMDRGDLRTALVATTVNAYPWVEKLSVALAIADALVYLHLLDPKVVHRDLKSRNILLDTVKGAKLTDFGISREQWDDETMTIGVGTYRWMAPEVLTDGHYSTAADMYSFGVICTELDTHALPYADKCTPAGNPLTESVIMAKVMAGELRPSFRDACPDWFRALGASCMDADPTVRPTAMEVAYALRVELRRAGDDTV
ncbi:TKL protein kinase [Saprolegnia diclina VS20]|uniref:TKL protein kinase n=1 Tax=Saprolegnia diclina (strain VS20) TaxID=1156394 RepID=T0QC13_SAPDV|nr:TKL protein kinase [Saprolegnia diclina VS20]EQC32251.1 TKL protein kinase [Saprolegnia diclina VS20]|eukprot:XP_008614192.1 TKL protein kinase [Saprolegnia diclina VS20]